MQEAWVFSDTDASRDLTLLASFIKVIIVLVLWSQSSNIAPVLIFLSPVTFSVQFCRM